MVLRRFELVEDFAELDTLPLLSTKPSHPSRRPTFQNIPSGCPEDCLSPSPGALVVAEFGVPGGRWSTGTCMRALLEGMTFGS